MLHKGEATIREIARLIGLMVAHSQAFSYRDKHWKFLKVEKVAALAKAKGDFDQKMMLSLVARQEIDWWIRNVGSSGRRVRQGKPDRVLFTDTSNEDWGAHVRELATGGRWLKEELEEHINVLELRAALLGLQSLCNVEGVHIRGMADNTTAVAYINHQGGTKSPECNKVTGDFWECAEARELWLSAAHIPGVENVLADFKSRNFSDNLEWSMRDKLYQRIVEVFGWPEIDLFATRLNKKVDRFVSWLPDPEAEAIDAFSIEWSNLFFYDFPPFSCVVKAVRKAIEEKASGILVVPWWPTKPWWGRLVALGFRQIYFRSRKGDLVTSGSPENLDFLSRAPLGAFLF